MMDAASSVYATSNDGDELGEASKETQVRVLLGARAGSKEAEDVIDVQVKRFLVKVWKTRRRVSAVINEVWTPRCGVGQGLGLEQAPAN